MNRKLKNFFVRGRVAIFITIASIGFVFVLNGLLDLFPKFFGGVLSIVIGLAILLVMGYFGYGIASRKNNRR